jgi:hypothetical protein
VAIHRLLIVQRCLDCHGLSASMGWTLPPLTGINVPKWKCYHHLNEKERPP